MFTHFNTYEQDKFRAQQSLAWKKLYHGWSIGWGRLAGYFIISQRKDKCLLHAVPGFVLAVALSFLTSERYPNIHILILVTCERQKLRRACARAHFQ